MCAISASFKFQPTDSFRALLYDTCRVMLGGMTSIECGMEKRFRGRLRRAIDIGVSEELCYTE